MHRDIPLLAGIALWSLLLQAGSAAFFSRSLESPNASTEIARHLVEHGEYAVPAWTVLRGPSAIGDTSPLRAYQLPGEPLYLASGFRILPPSAVRYLHVPVTALLMAAITAVALFAGGRRLALVTGILASIDPYVLFHGPVWDDTFLGAALEWTVFALLLAPLAVMGRAEARPDVIIQRPHVARRPYVGKTLGLLLLVVCAGVAAVTRLQAQLLLSAAGLAAILAPSLRPIRREGFAILVGVAIALGAWGVRNAAVLGHVCVSSTHDGITLFRANYATARPSILETGTAEWFDPDRLDAQYAATSRLGEVDADRYFRRAAIAYAASNPWDVVRTAALKLGVSLTGFDFSKPASSRRNTAFAPLNLGLLVLTVYAGLKWRRWYEPTTVRVCLQWLAGLTVGTTLLLLAIGPVGLRYRIDLTGLTYLALAAALLRLSRALRGVRT